MTLGCHKHTITQISHFQCFINKVRYHSDFWTPASNYDYRYKNPLFILFS